MKTLYIIAALALSACSEGPLGLFDYGGANQPCGYQVNANEGTEGRVCYD